MHAWFFYGIYSASKGRKKEEEKGAKIVKRNRMKNNSAYGREKWLGMVKLEDIFESTRLVCWLDQRIGASRNREVHAKAMTVGEIRELKSIAFPRGYLCMRHKTGKGRDMPGGLCTQ